MADEQPERRTENISMLNAVLQVHDKVDKIGKLLTDHITEESDVLASKVAKVLADSFPEGDAVGHRRAHEAAIADAEARAAFRQKMLFELTRWGLLGFLLWAGATLWRAFLSGPK